MKHSPLPDPARPWVTMNLAMTLDGKIATENRRFASFGSRRDQAGLYALRARADAVITGAGTVRELDADLNSGGPRYQRLRRRNGLQPENLRIVVSGSARLSASSRLFSEPGGPIILLTTTEPSPRRLKPLKEIGVHVGRFGKREVDFKSALIWLRRKWHVRRLHCEGGGELNDALFRAGSADELLPDVVPLHFGGRQAPSIAEGKGIARLADATRLRFVSIHQERSELFLRLRRECVEPNALPPSLSPSARSAKPVTSIHLSTFTWRP